MPGAYQHVYFQNEAAVEEIKQIAEKINTSFSAIISGLAEAGLPALKKAANKNQREVEMTIIVPLFGSSDGQT